MFNPATIILARDARGITQEDLALRVDGLSQANLSKIEKGSLGISSEMLEKLASALDFPSAFFNQSEMLMRSNFYYRKRYSVQGRSLKKLRAKIAILTHAIGNLLNQVEMKSNYSRLKFDLSEDWSPESAAAAVRNFLGIQPGPIINLTKAIESTGIVVFELPDDEVGFDGFTTYTDGGHPIIFLNKFLAADRKRMTLSHELGHVTMHLPFVLESYRDEESEANNFAASLLIPRSDIGGDLTGLTYHMLPDLKDYWKVSKAAIIRRAHDLGFIKPERYKYLNIELGRQGERKIEKGRVEFDSPTLLNKILEMYKKQAGYTMEQLVAISNLNPSDFNHSFYPETTTFGVVRKQIPLKFSLE